MATTLTNLYAGVAQHSKSTQAVLDTLAAGAGLLVLRGLGVKFEVGQLPVKNLLMGTGLVGLSGALGRETLNSFMPADSSDARRKQPAWADQNSNPIKLGAMAAFAIGAIVLSQADRVRNLSYAGRIVSMFPQFANRHQMIAFAVLSNLSMVGMRYYFGTPPMRKPLPEIPFYVPLKEISEMDYSELYQMFRGMGITHRLTSEQAIAYNAAAELYNSKKAAEQPELPIIRLGRDPALHERARRRERTEASAYAELPAHTETLPANSKLFVFDEGSELTGLMTEASEIAGMSGNPQGLYDMFTGHGTVHQLTEEQARAYNAAALEYNATETGQSKPLPLFYQAGI